MIKIVEKKRENKNIYIIQTYSKNKLIISKTLFHETSIYKHPNGFTYLILYDENMKPYPEVFNYLNTTISTYSINSRIKHLTALSFLYTLNRSRD